jgi:hypothetical protein
MHFGLINACHDIPAPLNDMGGAKEFRELLVCRISK